MSQTKWHYYLNWINSDINDNSARFYPTSLDHIWLSYGCYDNICLSSDLFRVLGSGMHDSDSCILPLSRSQNLKLQYGWKNNRRVENWLVETWIAKYKQKVTCNNRAAGIPTILLRPITTALFPLISTPDLCSNSMHPLGVHGTNKGSLPFIARRPMLSGWKPSTSFSMLTAFRMFCSLICWYRKQHKKWDFRSWMTSINKTDTVFVL